MTTTLTYYPAGSTQPRHAPATSATAIRALAEQLLNDYRTAGATRPGLELTKDDPDDGSELISIAVAEIGWAMIHTNPDYDQRCTRNPASSDTDSIDIDWGQPTPIPKHWFIPATTALPAIDQWLTNGHLDTDVFSSTDCA